VVYVGPLSRVPNLYCIKARADKENAAASEDAAAVA